MNNSVEQPCSKCSRDNAANKGTQKESHHHPVVQTGRIRKVQKTHSVLVGVVDGNGAESLLCLVKHNFCLAFWLRARRMKKSVFCLVKHITLFGKT